MPEQRCVLTDLFVSQCGHCWGIADAIEPDDVIWLGGVTAAEFGGRCALDVGHTIEPGDHIYKTSVGWACQQCKDIR